MSRQYDPKTGKWKVVSGGNKTTKKTTPQKTTKKKTIKKDTKKKIPKKTTPKKTTPKKTTKKKKSGGKRKTFNYFTAKVKVRPTDTTMKIKPASTIGIAGVGNYLGGKFYVQDISKTLDSNGLTLELTIIKVNFGRDGAKPEKKTSSKKGKTKKTKTKTHKVKKGETLLSIVKKYFKKKSKKVQKKHLNKMKKKNKIKNEKKKLKVGRKIYIV